MHETDYGRFGVGLCTGLIGFLFCCCVHSPLLGQDDATELKRFAASQVHMGVEVHIVAYCEDAGQAEQVIEAAFQKIAEIDRQFSNYKKDSSINQLAKQLAEHQRAEVDAELMPLFIRAAEIAELTEGSFDFTLGRLTRVWRWARETGTPAEKSDLQNALDDSGFDKIDIDVEKRTIQSSSRGLEFDFGGIAKGYAVDQALEEMARRGVDSAMVNAAGDIAVGDAPPGKPGWTIALESRDSETRDRQLLVVTNCGIATSGGEKQFFEMNGKRYSHILDPKTGLGITGYRRATIVARSAADADAFASAFNVMQVNKVKQFLKSDLGLSAKILYSNSPNQEIQVFQSHNFPTPNSN